jgi:hypothetical protein
LSRSGYLRDRVDSTLAQALELVLAAVLEHDAGA